MQEQDYEIVKDGWIEGVWKIKESKPLSLQPQIAQTYILTGHLIAIDEATATEPDLEE